jgi:hypothetical protein
MRIGYDMRLTPELFNYPSPLSSVKDSKETSHRLSGLVFHMKQYQICSGDKKRAKSVRTGQNPLINPHYYADGKKF